jgi:hypothetical protein
MNSNREYTDYLEDILEAATKARQFVKDVDFKAFCANNEKVFAVIRALEISPFFYFLIKFSAFSNLESAKCLPVCPNFFDDTEASYGSSRLGKKIK